MTVDAIMDDVTRTDTTRANATHDIAYIALGSNLGDRAHHLAIARDRMAAIPGIVILAESAIEETAPLGPPQPSYLNQIVAIDTTLSPPRLLEQLLRIERVGGRVRDVSGPRWGPRTIDLDIVAYEGQTWRAPALTVPHKELPNRPFWHQQLAQVRALLMAQQRVSGVPRTFQIPHE